MKLLGTIQSIGAPRSFARQDGSYGNAYPFVFSCELGRMAFEAFYTKESQEKRGFKVGAVGFIDVTASDRTYIDKYNVQRVTTDLRFNGWELANQSLSKAAPSADSAAQEQADASSAAAPQAPAAESAAQSATNVSDMPEPEGQLPF